MSVKFKRLKQIICFNLLNFTDMKLRSRWRELCLRFSFVMLCPVADTISHNRYYFTKPTRVSRLYLIDTNGVLLDSTIFWFVYNGALMQIII